MVYELVKGSNLALLLTVAQARLWVQTLVDGLSIDIIAVAGCRRTQKDAEGREGMQNLGRKRRRKDAKGGKRMQKDAKS